VSHLVSGEGAFVIIFSPYIIYLFIKLFAIAI